MNKPAAATVLRARDLSRDLLKVAQSGDMQAVVELDARRSRLLHEFFDGTQRIGDSDRLVLQEIEAMNDALIARIEQMRAGTGREMDKLGQGQRALGAYAAVQGHRG
jgi:hypothetical protein